MTSDKIRRNPPFSYQFTSKCKETPVKLLLEQILILSVSFLSRVRTVFDENRYELTLPDFWENYVWNFENSDFFSNKNRFFDFSDFFRHIFGDFLLRASNFVWGTPGRKKYFREKKLSFRKKYPMPETYPKIIGNASRSSENGPVKVLRRHYHGLRRHYHDLRRHYHWRIYWLPCTPL